MGVDGDPIPVPHTMSQQGTGKLLGAVGGLAVGDRPVAVADQQGLGGSSGVELQALGDGAKWLAHRGDPLCCWANREVNS